MTQATLDRPVTPTSVFKDDKLYTFYEVDLQFRGRVYGGLPVSRELLEA